jgi:hypothetical protein
VKDDAEKWIWSQGASLRGEIMKLAGYHPT